ncbi:MAG TPA: hypothetical protein VIK97_01195 [Casimicrobiaceae bacterium]
MKLANTKIGARLARKPAQPNRMAGAPTPAPRKVIRATIDA